MTNTSPAFDLEALSDKEFKVFLSASCRQRNEYSSMRIDLQ